MRYKFALHSKSQNFCLFVSPQFESCWCAVSTVSWRSCRYLPLPHTRPCPASHPGQCSNPSAQHPYCTHRDTNHKGWVWRSVSIQSGKGGWTRVIIVRRLSHMVERVHLIYLINGGKIYTFEMADSVSKVMF